MMGKGCFASSTQEAPLSENSEEAVQCRETREVRGQREPQMFSPGPPERTSGTFSDVSD